MSVFLGIIIGSSFSLSFILTVMHIRKAMSKRKSEEEERFRILEKQLSVVAEKCDRTHKACCLLSDIVKDNYKTEEKEERETSKTPYSEIDKINARNMGHQIIRYDTEKMVNSMSPALFPQTCSILNQQECDIEENIRRNLDLMRNCCQGINESGALRNSSKLFENQQQCSIEHSVSRETALMQNCCQGIIDSDAWRNSGMPFEEANKRLFHAFNWGISDDFD